MKIYFDSCCYTRPYDDLRQDRIRLEAEAVTAIFWKVELEALTLVSSDVLIYEFLRIPDENVRNRSLITASLAKESVKPNAAIRKRAAGFQAEGFRPLDAAHLSCAIAGGAEVFLTVDDPLLRRWARLTDNVEMKVLNPVNWILTLKSDEV